MALQLLFLHCECDEDFAGRHRACHRVASLLHSFTAGHEQRWSAHCKHARSSYTLNEWAAAPRQAVWHDFCTRHHEKEANCNMVGALQAWLVLTALLLLDVNGPTPLKRQPARTCKDLPYRRQWLPALLFLLGSCAACVLLHAVQVSDISCIAAELCANYACCVHSWRTHHMSVHIRSALYTAHTKQCDLLPGT